MWLMRPLVHTNIHLTVMFIHLSSMYLFMSESPLTLGVGQEAVERREVAWARGDSEGVVLRDAASLGNTCTPREMMESGI